MAAAKVALSEVAHDLQLFWFRYDCYKDSDYEGQYAIATRKKISQIK